MIEEKFLEIRDAGTKIPALAWKIAYPLDKLSSALLAAAGYGDTIERQSSYVFLAKLDGLETRHDPFHWSEFRTMKYAHMALTGILYHAVKNPDETHAGNTGIRIRCDESRFENLKSGDVLDIEWILGVTTDKKIAEAIACTRCWGKRVILSEIGQKDGATVCPSCKGTGLKPVEMLTASPPCENLAKKKKKGGR